MFSLFLIIAINVAAGIITFVSSAGKILDRRRKGMKVIRGGGWTLIASFIATIILAFVQYWHTESVNKKKELSIKEEQQKRDSIFEKQSRDNTKEVINTFTEALAKYGLKYDSSKKQILSYIRDSTKITTTIIEAGDPNFMICSDSGMVYMGSRKVDETPPFNTHRIHSFKLNFCNDGAISRNIDLDFVIAREHIKQDAGVGLSFIQKFLPQHFQMSPGERYLYKHDFFISDDISNPLKKIYVLVKGSYTSSDGSKTFKIDRMLSFDFTTKEFSFPPQYLEYQWRKNIEWAMNPEGGKAPTWLTYKQKQ